MVEEESQRGREREKERERGGDERGRTLHHLCPYMYTYRAVFEWRVRY